jgi:hypothetical protein
MTAKRSSKPCMSSPATYSVVVRGRLTSQWADWFNGTLLDTSQVDHGQQQTCLVCQVRDQSELMGILKQLNALNLPLIQVSLVIDEKNGRGG